MTNAQLKERLRKVQRSYPDFVNGVPSIVRHKPEIRKKLIEYLEAHEDARSDEVLAFIADEEGR